MNHDFGAQHSRANHTMVANRSAIGADRSRNEWRPLALFIFAIAALLTSARFSKAGGGPENVFLLVNENSEKSMTVANHYVDLRQLPPANVFYVKWPTNRYRMKGSEFREKLLLPAFEAIVKRGLAPQIDYLIFSCDFPQGLMFDGDFPNENFPQHLRPFASLTGAAYLSQFVVAKRKEMFNLNTNFYAVTPVNGKTKSRGFRSSYYWASNRMRTKDKKKGISYFLSTMLGVTYGRGSNVGEIIQCLKRAKYADGTRPNGTFYFMKNNNPRSVARHDGFPSAVKELRTLGVKAKILNGVFPQLKRDILGVTTGTAHFDIRASGSKLLPGSIGDNLTSAGAQFHVPKNLGRKPQTALTEFLRYGAAGACGTVIEPYAIQAKFPLPSIYAHYVRGCSLAEAFYQSVTGPFQLLIVGDPLCRPWAVIPQVKLEGIASEQNVSGQVEITPSATFAGRNSAGSDHAGQANIKRFELFVDGIRTQIVGPNKPFQWDTTKLADGYHDLRVVAVEESAVETQGAWIGNVIVKNGKDALQITLAPTERISVKSDITITVVSTTNEPVAVMHNHSTLGIIQDGNGSIEVNAGKLGKGPISIYAKTDAKSGIISRHVPIEIY